MKQEGQKSSKSHKIGIFDHKISIRLFFSIFFHKIYFFGGRFVRVGHVDKNGKQKSDAF